MVTKLDLMKCFWCDIAPVLLTLMISCMTWTKKNTGCLVQMLDIFPLAFFLIKKKQCHTHIFFYKERNDADFYSCSLKSFFRFSENRILYCPSLDYYAIFGQIWIQSYFFTEKSPFGAFYPFFFIWIVVTCQRHSL